MQEACRDDTPAAEQNSDDSEWSNGDLHKILCVAFWLFCTGCEGFHTQGEKQEAWCCSGGWQNIKPYEKN